MIVKCFRCTKIHKKHYINASFIHSLNESSESIQLFVHKDRHCVSPNVHTIHPICDIGHF